MNFPIAAWQTTGATRIDITIGGVTEAKTITAGKWGFGLQGGFGSTSGLASTDSIAGALAAAITSHSSPATATATYYYDGTQKPCRYGVTVTAACTVTFPSLAAAQAFGYGTTTVAYAANTERLADFNPTGLFFPGGSSGDVNREVVQRAAASSSEMSGAATDVVNIGEIADLEFSASIVPCANVFLFRAQTAIYATQAGRDVADPNNTLEGLLAAAANGATFRLYRVAASSGGTTPTTYMTGKLPAVSKRGSAKDFISPVDEPRQWNVSGLTFREQ